MDLWQILVAVTCFLYVHSSENVVEFDMVEKVERWQILRQGKTIHRKLKIFSETTCDGGPIPPSWPVRLMKLDITPDPVVIPGSISLSFNLNVTETMDKPLKLDVYMEMKSGQSWIKIPCLGIYGSCTYDDLCKRLEVITTCPDPFQQEKVPCKCPFKLGFYKMPPFKIYIGEATFPSGNYHMMATLFQNSKLVGCYNVTASIENE